MDITTALILIGLIYFWFYSIDVFLKSCSHYPYIRFLQGTGLEIRLFQLKWSTTAFNQLITRWGSNNRRLNIWFTVGFYTTLILYPISIIIFIVAFFQNFVSIENGRSIIIEPVLPGLNLPASELTFYAIALLVSSIVHEFGHAIAAVQEDVNIYNIGAHVLFILPFAFVNLNNEKFSFLNPWKRLKILCAGIWHNLMVALFAYLIYLVLPYIFTPLFHTNTGVTITKILDSSPLHDTNGLIVGDVITRINECDVYDEGSWYACLTTAKRARIAFCIEEDLVHGLDESIPLKHLEKHYVECCGKKATEQGNLCFEYLDSQDNILEFPPYVCLPARRVIEKSSKFCTHTPHICPKKTSCFRPILNMTQLFKVKRMGSKDVIYVGLDSDFSMTIDVSSYVIKYAYISTKIPDLLTKCCEYMIFFSVSLAFVNVIPCLFTDGQHISNVLFYLMFSSTLRQDRIRFISSGFSGVFTLLLVIHCLFNVWLLIKGQ